MVEAAAAGDVPLNMVNRTRRRMTTGPAGVGPQTGLMTADSLDPASRAPSARARFGDLTAVVGSRAGRLVSVVRAGYWAEFGLVSVVLLSLVLVRTQLGPWRSGDYQMFLVGWFDFLRLQGFHGLGSEFADYNMPYLYLLYLGSVFTSDSLGTVKVIAGLSDLALALGAFAVLRQLRVQRELALVASAATLLLPEVLMNSAAWGQADSTYTSILVWALWAALRGRGRTTWILFALAFTFKLQAAFVLPAFVILHVVKRWGWQGPLLGVLTVLATEIPALVAGRSPSSLAAIYFKQANSNATLTMNAPSIYALLPESQHDVLRSAGMYFALAAVGILSFVVLRAARRKNLDGPTALLFVAVLATLAPYTLPLMHERYFYVANVLLLLYAVASRKLVPWVFVAQAVAISAYSPFLFGRDSVQPMGMLALVEGAVLFVMIRQLLRATEAFPVASLLADTTPTESPTALSAPTAS